LCPTLRLGYLVVSSELVDKFASARLIMDRHSSVIDQAILCDFITEGHFGRHIRRMREVYAGRLAVLRESVKRQLCGVLRIPEVEAGVHTVGWLADGLDAATVARLAAVNNVEVAPLNAFALKSPVPQGWLLGFGAVDHREIRRGVEVLAAVIEKSTKAAWWLQAISTRCAGSSGTFSSGIDACGIEINSRVHLSSHVLTEGGGLIDYQPLSWFETTAFQLSKSRSQKLPSHRPREFCSGSLPSSSWAGYASI
jgi:hypothetical protein